MEKKKYAAALARWNVLTAYEKFEHAVILILTGLIAIVIVAAVWNLGATTRREQPGPSPFAFGGEGLDPAHPA